MQKELHVAIIMDGNGRWATRRGLPRVAGHRAGIATVRRVVEHAPDLGIRRLTLYAFSSDNWRRPADEVESLFWLLRAHLRLETERLRRRGARMEIIGRRDRLPSLLLREIARAENATAEGRRLHLRVAVDYSSREAITRAAAGATAVLSPDRPPSADLLGRILAQALTANAQRAYRIADHYRSKGAFVCFGGLHVTSLPGEAALHADVIFLGPGEQIFPQFLEHFRAGKPERVYSSTAGRTLERVPPVRRDLIRRNYYLVPNSIVVTRGCPQHCDFCYKDAFFQGGRGFYAQRVDDALAEIERLPGRHLYFLDDHLLGDRRFAEALFDGMKGMKRLFQGAATVDSILRGELIERAAEAGLRSIFVGFETFTPENLKRSNKRQNLGRDYKAVADRLHSLGIMINGSFVFGMDDDDQDVFRRTVDWAVEHGITTATFHIQTPYPGTQLHARMVREGRMLTRDWNLYDTRHVVYRPARLKPEALKAGYDWACYEFYRWRSIARASLHHGAFKHEAKHFFYASGWKKFEPVWDLMIRARQLTRVTPLLEAVLSRVTRAKIEHGKQLGAASSSGILTRLPDQDAEAASPE